MTRVFISLRSNKSKFGRYNFEFPAWPMPFLVWRRLKLTVWKQMSRKTTTPYSLGKISTLNSNSSLKPLQRRSLSLTTRCVYLLTAAHVLESIDVGQILSRNMTNLTPAQLEQFESTFRYFDRDETSTLVLSEFSAALASLGIIYSVCMTPHATFNMLRTMQDEDFVYVYDQLVQEYGAVTFEAFINLLVCIRSPS